MVAERATVEGTGSTLGVLPGVDGLIPAELVAELAASALTVPAIPAKYPLDFPWSPPGVYGNQTAGTASRTCCSAPRRAAQIGV